MPADLTQLFSLGRIAALPVFPPIEGMADHLSLGEMMDILEDAQAGLLPDAGGSEEAIELSEMQWAFLVRLSRKGVIPPWEVDLIRSAAIFDEMGYLVTVALRSDNLRDGGGFVRVRLTPKGCEAVSMRRRQAGGEGRQGPTHL